MKTFTLKNLLLVLTICALAIWILVSTNEYRRAENELKEHNVKLRSENGQLRMKLVYLQEKTFLELTSRHSSDHSKRRLSLEIAESLSSRSLHDAERPNNYCVRPKGESTRIWWMALLHSGKIHDSLDLEGAEEILGPHCKFGDLSEILESDGFRTSDGFRPRNTDQSYVWHEENLRYCLTARPKDGILGSWEIFRAK